MVSCQTHTGTIMVQGSDFVFFFPFQVLFRGQTNLQQSPDTGEAHPSQTRHPNETDDREAGKENISGSLKHNYVMHSVYSSGPVVQELNHSFFSIKVRTGKTLHFQDTVGNLMETVIIWIRFVFV